MLSLESLQFFHFTEASHEPHEDPNFDSITVHEEVVDLVEVVRLHDEHDKFLLSVSGSFHSDFLFFFSHYRPGIRVFESLHDSQRESALFVAQESPNLFAFRVVSLNFLGARNM